MDLRRILLTLAPVAAAVVVGGCSNNWPYEPEPHAQAESGPQIAADFSLYNINSNIQTCNPSVSQDIEDFPGCMLWLNFQGQLNVSVGTGSEGYTTEGVPQHDRLTISDTSNTVQWYMMNSEMGIPEGQHIQDPEWSTHPDYLACLGDMGPGLQNFYSPFVVSTESRAVMRLSNTDIGATSTPHLWVERGHTGGSVNEISYLANLEGFADSASAATFFGTNQVKVVYAADGMSRIRYIDYTTGTPTTGTLIKPAGKESWVVESPLISPDGSWVVYNCAERINGSTYSAYAQRLAEGAKPILIAENGSSPHWWVHPEFGDLYVIYTEVNGDFLVTEKYTVGLEEDGNVGATYKLQVKASSSDLPGHAQFTKVGSPIKLINLPFKGGLSPDGRYLATGYQFTYMASFR